MSLPKSGTKNDEHVYTGVQLPLQPLFFPIWEEW